MTKAQSVGHGARSCAVERMRIGEVNGKRITEYFDCFGPKVLNGRENLPDALESRCSKIVMLSGVQIKGTKVKHIADEERCRPTRRACSTGSITERRPMPPRSGAGLMPAGSFTRCTI